MTDLETMQRAKMYMDKLARGIDPVTNQELPEDSALNQVRLARCFLYVSDVLEQVIANGGVVGAKPKQKRLPFAATMEQLAGIPVSEEPVVITQLVDRINEALNNPQMKKLSTTTITNWLLEKGFMEKQAGPDGKSRRVPAANGNRIGLSVQTRQGMYGDYLAVYYSKEAQQFIIDNLPQILGGE